MNRGRLLFVPSGGLANRMRAIASAWNLCKQVGAQLQIVWFQGWGMHAAFKELFEPLPNLREAVLWDFVVNDRPRRHNLWLPYIPQQLWYMGGVINELDVANMRDNGYDFEKWLQNKHRYMSCYDEFGTFSNSCYSELFHPNQSVMDIVYSYETHFSQNVIGMHIRRTDNLDSISKSPTDLFIEAGQREIDNHNDLTIFLATDSEEVKRQMRERFGDRIVTSKNKASRDSIAGIREGLADMWTLSRISRIYGSSGSSFSTMASKIGGQELIILER